MKLPVLVSLVFTVSALPLTLAPAYAQDIDIAFGDDTSSWANDGECDDPRFEGAGMASGPLRENRLADATDCKTLFDEGEVRFSAVQYDPSLTIVNGTNLGDNSWLWAHDDECDDARFIGEGMASTPSLEAMARDRHDCSYGLQLGALTLAETLPEPVEAEYDGIDFGHDKGGYPHDDECDDPRFDGPDFAIGARDSANIGGDRADCLAAYKEGHITFKERFVIDDVYFGDDQSLYPSDGECDDPRFAGTAMAAKPTLAGLAHDAADCMPAWRAETIRLVEELDTGGTLIRNGILFGDDLSSLANEDACNDPGFAGEGMSDGNVSSSYAGHDRSDCVAAFEAGQIKPAPVLPISETILRDGVLYGDDSGAYPSDGECDDPRFEGEAMATSLRTEERFHDASDCLAAVEGGTAALKQ